jgi:hypothetical protein
MNAYSGSRGEEIPRSFTLHDEKVEIVAILARWIEEGTEERRRRRVYQVKGSDGYTHRVYYDEREKAWFLGKAG